MIDGRGSDKLCRRARDGMRRPVSGRSGAPDYNALDEVQ